MADLESAAVKGYCGECYWKPCQCGLVCETCTREHADCLCVDLEPGNRQGKDEDE